MPRKTKSSAAAMTKLYREVSWRMDWWMLDRDAVDGDELARLCSALRQACCAHADDPLNVDDEHVTRARSAAESFDAAFAAGEELQAIIDRFYVMQRELESLFEARETNSKKRALA